MKRKNDKKLIKRKKLLIISTVVFALALICFVLYYYLIYIPYTTSYDSSPSLCKTIKVNDENGINLVFFSNEENAKKYSDYLFSVSPLVEMKDKFNIYYVDNYIPKCDIYRGVAILCYSKELLRKAAVCPNDYVFVLQEKEEAIRSSSYLNVLSVNTVHPLSVIVHEFGHSFANLAEEYIPGKIPRGSKNCQSSCDKFDSETDGCFLECSEGDYYRSIENGVMRTLQTSKLGIFNEKLFRDSFSEQYSESENVLTGRQISEFTDCSKQVYYESIFSSVDGSKIGVAKKLGCPGKFNYVVDTDLVFTDSWEHDNEILAENEFAELPEENVKLITGETYLASEVGVDIVQQIPKEIVEAQENKTLEFTIVTKEIVKETSPEGVISDVIKETSVPQEVDFKGLPEPEPDIKKKGGILAESTEAIKYFIANEFSESKELSPVKESEVFESLKNESNFTEGNETNYTSGKFDIPVNETNSSGKFDGSKEDKLTGSAVRELSSDKKYWILIAIILILAVIYYLKRKR